MAIFLTKPKSLSCTALDGGALTALTLLTEATFSDAKEINEIMTGESNFPITFPGGKKDIVLTVTSLDFDKFDDVAVGTLYGPVALEAVGFTCGTSTESTITITLSKAIIMEKGEVSMSGEGNEPASFTVSFKMVRECSDVAEPSYTVVVS
jgi:hypothetical protein